MALAMLQDWCHRMGVSPQHSVLILGIPDDCENQEFQEAVQAALQHVGRFRVLGRVFRRDLQCMVAFIEFTAYLNRRLIPQQIPGRGGPWTVVFLPHIPASESQDRPDFPAQPPGVAAEEGAVGAEAAGAEGASGAEAAGAEGASGAEAAGAEGASGAEAAGEQGAAGAEAAGEERAAGEEEVEDEEEEAAGEEEGEAEESEEEGAAGDTGLAGRVGTLSMAGAAGEAGAPGEEAVGVAGAPGQAGAWNRQWRQELQPILENMAYEELRTFTGLEGRGREAESFESWLDHTNDMLYLWRHISEGERRRRLLESLRGPALGLVNDVLTENPDSTANDCLAALIQVYGKEDTLTTARLKFMTCTQRPQEALFTYVMRLEVLLQAAMEKGAVQPSMADQVRARQVLMRARPNETLWNNLRRMRLERRPPNFMGMLRLIRESEALETSPSTSQRVQVGEGASVDIGDLADAQAAPAREETAPASEEAAPAREEAAPAREDASQAREEAAPAREDAAQAAPAREDGAEAALASAAAREAGSGPADPDKAAPETPDATGADPVPEEPTKASLAVQGDADALASAALGEAGSSPARMGSASGAEPEGPGSGPEGQAQAADQEAEEPAQERLKPILEESESEDGAGEMSFPKPSLSK
ncbi:paraneoplastic antigen Ma6F-like [Saccopteryx leptura]|uniref:paraneoplastic antigen Ma6F-like n=1 Tax=Saccopteryx leptura TaxID=249018 RepID=UPI00339BFB0C